MTRDVILNSIARNEQLKSYARKTTSGNSLWEDIISEMLLCLYEMPEERLIQIYRTQGLVSYCYKIIHLSWNSPNSPFYKKYKAPEPRIDNEVFDYDYELDVTLEKCEKAVAELVLDVSDSGMPTKKILFDAYLELGSIRKVAKRFRIPTMTMAYIITNTKEELRQKI